MTKINWGEAIQVDGVRPEWLRDDELVWFRCHDGYEDCDGNTIGHLNGRGSSTDWFTPDAGDDMIVSIRLPADHPYYLATSKGFTYWPGGDSAPDDWDGGDSAPDDWDGGDSAPDDWDGGDVLYRKGHTNSPVPQNWSWQRAFPEYDIIGYKRTAAPDVSPELVNRMVQLVRDLASRDDSIGDEARAIAADLPDAPTEPVSDMEMLRGMIATLGDRIKVLERKIGRRP